MPLTHYTVGYHDTDFHKYEICEYAVDAYNAIQHSKEDVPYLREHPYSLYEILNEDHLFKNGKFTS